MYPPHSESKRIPHNAFQGHCSIYPHALLMSAAMIVLSPSSTPRCSQCPQGIAGPCMCCSFHLEYSSHCSCLPYLLYLNATFPGSLSWTLDSKQQPFPDTPSLCPAFLPGSCFLGHLTLDLLSSTFETVSPTSPQHLEQCLAHSRCSVRTCGTNPSPSTSNVQTPGKSVTRPCLSLLIYKTGRTVPLQPTQQCSEDKVSDSTCIGPAWNKDVIQLLRPLPSHRTRACWKLIIPA